MRKWFVCEKLDPKIQTEFYTSNPTEYEEILCWLSVSHVCMYVCNFFNSHIGGWSPNWVHSARRPLNGLLYLPRVIMMMENLVEQRLAGETEVLGENLAQRHFVHHESHLPDPGSNPGRRGGKPATNRLSYGAACVCIYARVRMNDWKNFVHISIGEFIHRRSVSEESHDSLSKELCPILTN
jgi:hypothetical protein